MLLFFDLLSCVLWLKITAFLKQKLSDGLIILQIVTIIIRVVFYNVWLIERDCINPDGKRKEFRIRS